MGFAWFREDGQKLLSDNNKDGAASSSLLLLIILTSFAERIYRRRSEEESSCIGFEELFDDGVVVLVDSEDGVAVDDEDKVFGYGSDGI